MSIKDEPWFNDPFDWYEQEGYPEIVGIAVTDKVALDFLQALYQIYKRLERKAIDELIIQEVNAVDIDAAFAEMIEEQND